MGRHKKLGRPSRSDGSSDGSSDDLLATSDSDKESRHQRPYANDDENASRRRISYIGWGVFCIVILVILGVLLWAAMTGKLGLGGAQKSDHEPGQGSMSPDNDKAKTESDTLTESKTTDLTSETPPTTSPTVTDELEDLGTTATTTTEKVHFTGDTGPTTTTDTETQEPKETKEAGQPMEQVHPKPKQDPTPTVSVNWALYSNVPSTLPKDVPEGVHKVHVEFKAMTNKDSLVSFLEDNGMTLIDGKRIDSDPLDYEYKADLAKVEEGRVKLTVKKGEENGVTRGAQITTKEDKIQFGLITTRAKLSAIEGIRQVIQFAFDKEDAIEIGMPSSFYGSTRGITGVTAGMQTKVVNKDSSRVTFTTYGFSPEEDFHDYSVFWTPDYVVTFIDGKSFGTSQIEDTHLGGKASLRWAAWSNGNERFSVGPPPEDASFEIAWIDGWYLTKP
ncbi:hypothetical protein OIO90_004587 [Microbotryomycetes sp. JL221]|nr:hypothetical protein OIO90_004587 [Microbotryomycetes sp. JL221]